jgi:hypothetical protein
VRDRTAGEEKPQAAATFWIGMSPTPEFHRHVAEIRRIFFGYGVI